MGPLDVQGHVDFWWRAGLTSTKMYQSVLKGCPSLGKVKPDKACRALLAEMMKDVGDFQQMGKGAGWWNVYNIYDTCTDMPHLQGAPSSGELLAIKNAEHSATWVCGGRGTETNYFNRADVQKALHVNRTTKWGPDDDGL